jgi:hypothetical protein
MAINGHAALMEFKMGKGLRRGNECLKKGSEGGSFIALDCGF